MKTIVALCMNNGRLCSRNGINAYEQFLVCHSHKPIRLREILLEYDVSSYYSYLKSNSQIS